eukprot:CAMPEP_0185021230 /NCGR_PEP_ID=MMETSP1103-20130426/3906_1 /TAXON_ID=36769 /ORGANISM="Paraphysomonas bandaiensis, Strain Caron Lab Isolate" /LENGTH=381 /DNA_ID=CAMNT_0027552629 /DNA_START=136 /DNA_END=1278 /DNA_ORIENTATION=+
MDDFRSQHIFREFNDFEIDSYDIRDFNSDAVSSIDQKDFSFEAVDFDTKYRSIQAIDPSSLACMAPMFSRHEPTAAVAGPPQLRKSSNTVPSDDQFLTKHSVGVPTIIQGHSNDVSVPEKPFYIGPSQFLCALCLTELVTSVEIQLNRLFEVSYKFHKDQCRWEAIYLRGSSRCKFEINVYKENEGGFVVEGNRLSGDGIPFSKIFREIKLSLCPGDSPVDTAIGSGRGGESIPLPVCEPLSAEEAAKAILPILGMANSKHIESRTEAAKILCDLSLQQDMHRVMCDSGCVSALVQLVQSEDGGCSQHAVCALANISSSRPCQDVMVSSKAFLPALLSLSVDGPFYSAEMRRECARTLANLCSGLAPRVLESVGADTASSW